MDIKWKENLNLPNVLTMLRMGMIPVYIVLFVGGHKYWALTVFLLAGATDVADGTIARKYNLITDFGKLMDPLADKLMGLTVLLSMTIGNETIPAVVPLVVVIVIFLKEILMVVGGIVMLGRSIVVYSRPIGKAAQVLLTTGLTASFFHETVQGFWAWQVSLDVFLLYAAMGLTLVALGFYALSCVRQLSAQKNNGIE